ncbi:MAG: tetratricopeptide repeat protein, partial [Pirellulaceae bacterium]|nr:tetratricopeptide repeat protein [Pirellulaceae bacterium]
EQLEQYPNALVAYVKAIGVDPDYADAYCGMGSVYENLGQDTDALDVYKKAVAANPDDAMSYCRMGVVYCKLGQNVDASVAFESAIAIEPTGRWANLAREMSRGLCGSIELPDTE